MQHWPWDQTCCTELQPSPRDPKTPTLSSRDREQHVTQEGVLKTEDVRFTRKDGLYRLPTINPRGPSITYGRLAILQQWQRRGYFEIQGRSLTSLWLAPTLNKTGLQPTWNTHTPQSIFYGYEALLVCFIMSLPPHICQAVLMPSYLILTRNARRQIWLSQLPLHFWGLSGHSKEGHHVLFEVKQDTEEKACLWFQHSSWLFTKQKACQNEKTKNFQQVL